MKKSCFRKEMPLRLLILVQDTMCEENTLTKNVNSDCIMIERG